MPKVKKLNEMEFCIILLWVRGMSVSNIAKTFGRHVGKSAGAVRGIVDRNMERPRAEMSQAERQELLDEMKANRMDGGRFPDSYYVAMKLAEQQKAVKPTYTRAQIEEAAEVEREKHNRQRGHAPRGALTSPLEYLYNQRLLADPDETPAGKVVPISEGNNKRRYQAGGILRGWFYSAYQSGVKTQNYEAVGGSGRGAGVVVHATMAEAIANLEKIRGIMEPEEFRLLDRLLRFDAVVWEAQGAAKQANAVMEEVHRALDIVSVFLELMAPVDFKMRWGPLESISKVVDRKKVRSRTRRANEAIAEAARKVG